MSEYTTNSSEWQVRRADSVIWIGILGFLSVATFVSLCAASLMGARSFTTLLLPDPPIGILVIVLIGATTGLGGLVATILRVADECPELLSRFAFRPRGVAQWIVCLGGGGGGVSAALLIFLPLEHWLLAAYLA